METPEQCEIWSELTVKTSERGYGIFIVYFEQVNADWIGSC